MSKSADPDQTRRLRRCGWSGSTLFAYAGHIIRAPDKVHIFISIMPIYSNKSYLTETSLTCDQTIGEYKTLVERIEDSLLTLLEL